MTKHLYIHIPFCKNICTYCDFVRIKTYDTNLIANYCNEIIKQVKLASNLEQYETIYIGGGTPNYIPDSILEMFLFELSKYIDYSSEYEFTIECNPEFLTSNQAKIFHKNKINRVSIGGQILNNKILKLLNRNHNKLDIVNAIKNCYNNNINNISVDFIYNLPFMTIQDIDDIFDFIKLYKIPHISFYSLELKENSILNKKKYKLNIEKDEQQFIYIKSKFEEINYQRYEISNWALNEQYLSKHNLAYWNSKSWKAIGSGAHGFEYQKIYKINKDNKNKYNIEIDPMNLKDYYFQIIMMGLRLSKGINISIEPYKSAYNFFKDKIKNCTIDNNYLKCNNIDLLDDLLLNLLD